MSDYQKELDLLIDATRAAGPIAMKFFEGEVKSWDKGDDDPVSEADHAVNDILRDVLRPARPDYGWLSEEDPDDLNRLDRARVWMIDPIDGTRSFLKKTPEFTICAGLVENGRPIAGVVYNPAKNELFEATLGGGARLNGVAISVNHEAEMETARFLAARQIFDRAGWRNAPKRANFAYVNSIAYRMMMVACGRHDACVSLAEKCDWDIAAAELIVLEAGGKVTTSKHEGFDYNKPVPRHRSLIIAPNALHREVMDFLDQVERPAGKTW